MSALEDLRERSSNPNMPRAVDVAGSKSGLVREGYGKVASAVGGAISDAASSMWQHGVDNFAAARAPSERQYGAPRPAPAPAPAAPRPPAMPVQVPRSGMPIGQPAPGNGVSRTLPLDSMENFPNRGQPVGTMQSYAPSAPRTPASQPTRYYSPDHSGHSPLGTINGMSNMEAISRIQGTKVPMYDPAPQAAPRRPKFDARIRGIMDEMEKINAMVSSGKAANGRTLTADGLNAYRARADSLDGSLNEIFGEMSGLYDTDANNARALTQTDKEIDGRLANTDLTGQYGLSQQGMANEGALQRQIAQNYGQITNTRIGKEYDLEHLITSGEPGFRRAQTAAIEDTLHQQGLPPTDFRYDPTYNPEEYRRETRAADVANNMVVRAGSPQGGLEMFTQLLAGMGLTNLVNPSEAELLAAAQANPGIGEVFDGYLNLQSRIAAAQQMPRQQVYGMAEGGLVPPAGPAAPPQQQSVGAMQNYQQYVEAARQMGLPPIPLEQFVTMAGPTTGAAPGMPQMQPNAQATQQVYGMAEGGEVPEAGMIANMMGNQVDGQMVMDTDPNAPTDSIPAMIDGQQPAALDSGEFVLPKDVVMFYGTEKLNKLIEKARGGGQQQSEQEYG